MEPSKYRCHNCNRVLETEKGLLIHLSRHCPKKKNEHHSKSTHLVRTAGHTANNNSSSTTDHMVDQFISFSSQRISRLTHDPPNNPGEFPINDNNVGDDDDAHATPPSADTDDDRSFRSDQNVNAAPPFLIYHEWLMNNSQRHSKMSDVAYPDVLQQILDNDALVDNDERILTSDDSSQSSTEDEDDLSRSTLPPHPIDADNEQVPISELFESQTNVSWKPPRGNKTIWFSDDPIPEEWINTVIDLSNQNQKDNHTGHVPLSAIEKLMIRIDWICEKANCPGYVPDLLMDAFAQAVREDNLDLKLTGYPKYATFLKSMARKFPASTPEVVPVTLESKINRSKVSTRSRRRKKKRSKTFDSVESNVESDQQHTRAHVVRNDLLDLLEDILTDPKLVGNKENFDGVVNWNDPFGQLGVGIEGLDELVTGKWYKETYQMCCDIVRNSKWPNDIPAVLPMGGYLDAIGTDKLNRVKLEPFLISLYLFNRSCRNKDFAKRLLGYLPESDLKSAAQKEIDRAGEEGFGSSCRNYHTMLRVLIEEIIRCQGFEERLIGFLRIGDEVRIVRFFFPMPYIVGDGKSSDMLSGRYSSSQCLLRSRLCHCPTDQLSNPYHICTFIDQGRVSDLCHRGMSIRRKGGNASLKEIDDLVSIKKELKSLSRYLHNSAFVGLNLGSDPLGLGVLLATPCDTMHMYQHGLMKNSNGIVISNLTPNEKASIDRLVHHTFARYRSSEKTKFPRCNYVRGITNLTLVTAEEWVGVTFTLLLVLHNREGWYLMEKALERQRIKVNKEFGDVSKWHTDMVRTRDLIQKLSSKKILRDSDKKKLHQLKKELKDLNSKLDRFRQTYHSKVASERALSKPDVIDSEQLEDKDPDSFQYSPYYVPTCAEIMQLLEALLSFYAWYRRPPHKPWVPGTVQDSIRTMLKMVVDYAPRTEGYGWNIQKFHDTLHLAPLFMDQFGSAMNFDAGNWEHSLIHFGTRVARRSQKRNQDETLLQSAKLHSRYMSLAKARRSLSSNECSKQRVSEANNTVQTAEQSTHSPDSTNNGLGPQLSMQVHAQYKICLRDDNGNRQMPRFKWLSKKASQSGNRDVHPCVLSFFMKDYESNPELYDDSSEVLCYTACRLNGVLYRCDPNFRSSGPWYDWTLLKFKGHDACPTGSRETPLHGRKMFPSKLLCLFQRKAGDKLTALVHSTEGYDAEASSTLCEVWKMYYSSSKYKHRDTGADMLEPFIEDVPIETFRRRVFVVEEAPGLREGIETWRFGDGIPRCTLVHDMDYWAKQFTGS